MSERRQNQAVRALRDAAVTWHVRLQSDAAVEADWLGFEAWLAEPGARQAYDAIDQLWADLDLDRDALASALQQPTAPARPYMRSGRGSHPGRPGRTAPTSKTWAAMAGAAAAAAAAAFVVVAIQPGSDATHWTVYATPKGASRTVTLADGTVMALNGGSSVKVSLEPGRRRVVMGDAEAAFDVAKDAKRPFLIQAGDDQVRVVGTRFDVLRHDGRVVVTVEHGVVEVRQAMGGDTRPVARLVAGQQYLHRAGMTQASVRTVDPSDALAWRRGRLIYRDSELADVVSDLNRYFATPLRVAPGAAGLRFSGVLAVDSQGKVLRRLEALMPVKAASENGAVVLRRRGGV
jgi:transmembrane sensor